MDRPTGAAQQRPARRIVGYTPRRGGAIARVRRRFVSFKTALVAFEVAHEIGEIGIGERVAVRRHQLATLPDLLDYRRIAHGLTRAQSVALEDVLQRRSGFRVLIVAVPALVIVDLLAALRALEGACFHLVNFRRTLIRVLRGALLACEGGCCR